MEIKYENERKSSFNGGGDLADADSRILLNSHWDVKSKG